VDQHEKREKVLVKENKVNQLIKNFKTDYQDAFWDGYTLVVWKRDASGFSNKRGMFRNNTWGLTNRFAMNDKGTWELPDRYVKYIK
jgi:hypothetical protein